MEEKRKFISLFSLLLVLIVILIIMIIAIDAPKNKTSTRYIKREKDEIRAYYTSLYFDGTGQGSGVAIENNIGFVSFDLMNFIGEDVTKRDIEYQIKTVDKYYDADGKVITNPDGNQDLYVLDVWEQPVKIGNDTYKYDFSIEENNGEVSTDKNYLFSYEKRGTSAVGKTHKVTVKIKRNETIDHMASNEKISIVIQILKPYKTVYVIDMYASDRLILFSDIEKELFETNFKTLQIQTMDVFSHNGEFVRTTNEDSPREFTSKAFKVELTWNNLILNENMLKNIHNNIFDKLGTTDADNLDISKPYIVSINQTSNFGKLVIYIPEGSNFDLDFFPTSNDCYVKAKIYIYIDNNYELYTQELFGGYQFDENDEITIIPKMYE